MPQPSSIHLPWLEDRIADIWPLADTVDIARKILVPESWVANALARMRRRNDPRLRSVTSR